jgi:hypothetical protein
MVLVRFSTLAILPPIYEPLTNPYTHKREKFVCLFGRYAEKSTKQYSQYSVHVTWYVSSNFSSKITGSSPETSDVILVAFCIINESFNIFHSHFSSFQNVRSTGDSRDQKKIK